MVRFRSSAICRREGNRLPLGLTKSLGKGKRRALHQGNAKTTGTSKPILLTRRFLVSWQLLGLSPISCKRNYLLKVGEIVASKSNVSGKVVIPHEVVEAPDPGSSANHSVVAPARRARPSRRHQALRSTGQLQEGSSCIVHPRPARS
jgi:hypothetical protein